jgi:hypothetical protein
MPSESLQVLSQTSMETPMVTGAELERGRRESLCPSERADAISYDWARIGICIALAGGAYPLVLAAIWLAVGAVGYTHSVIIGDQSRPDFADAVSLLIAIGLYAVVFGALGLLWSGLVSAVTLPLVYLFVWSLRLRGSIVRIGAFAGGLVGFICVAPVTLGRPWISSNSSAWQTFLYLLLGPALTTVLGQLGGAWGGSKSREIGPARDSNEGLQAATWRRPAPLMTDVDSLDGPRFQFGIRHLLWISVWFSLLLALIRLCRIPFEWILPILLSWLAFQTVTLWLGGLLLPRVIRWRERRRHARST